jgi:hypothetical protein
VKNKKINNMSLELEGAEDIDEDHTIYIKN